MGGIVLVTHTKKKRTDIYIHRTGAMCAFGAVMEFMAISRDKELDAILRNGSGGVLAVYDRAVYLETEPGALAVLVPEGVGNGPGYIVVGECGALGNLSLEADDRFLIRSGRIEIGGGKFVVIANSAKKWDTHLQFPGCPSLEELEPSFRVVIEIAGSKKSADGLSEFFGKIDELFGMGAEAAHLPLYKKVFDFARSLAAREPEKVKAAAEPLIGLGMGLTPSCDDMLVGSCAFLHALSFSDSHRKSSLTLLSALDKAIGRQSEKTTPISRHFLKAAVRGRFIERVKDLLYAIFSGDGKRLEGAMERVLGYGATSGIDLIFGIALGFRAMAELPRFSRW